MQLTAAHWIFLAGVVVILAAMVMRKNIVVPAVVATFLTALVYTGSLATGLSSVFNASLVAATSLFSIFLIIAMVTAMLRSLEGLGADRRMVAPFRKVMRNGHLAFWTLVIVTYFISLFFWPTPAVPLIGAVLVPVAIRAGLRPLAAGFTVAIAGQGMALSSDYVIRVAPGLSATAANADPAIVADRAFVLSLIVGGIALAIGYAMEVRKMRRPVRRVAGGLGGRRRPRFADRRRRGDHRRGLDGRGGVGAGTGAGPRWPAASRPPASASSSVSVPAAGTSRPRCSRSPRARSSVTAWRCAARPPVSRYPPRRTRSPPVEKPLASKFFAVFVPLAYLALIVYLVVASVSDVRARPAGRRRGGSRRRHRAADDVRCRVRPQPVDVHGDLGRAHRRRPRVRLQGHGCRPADRRLLLPRQRRVRRADHEPGRGRHGAGLPVRPRGRRAGPAPDQRHGHRLRHPDRRHDRRPGGLRVLRASR